MSRTVVIVGGNAGGASTAARLRRLDEDAEIILFERGEHVSYGSCGLPYYLSDAIEDREELLVQTPESLETRFDLDVRTGSEVVDLDTEAHEVVVSDADGRYTQSYDALVLSPGAAPTEPPIDGIEDVEHVYTLRTIPDGDAIREQVERAGADSALVVGAGYIGLEVVENLHDAGLDVSLAEMQDHVLQSLDEAMAAQVHNHLRDHGVDLRLGTTVEAFRNAGDATGVVLDDGERLSVDLVVLATGVRPRTELAEAGGLELGASGAINVDDHMRTSAPDVYAVGDAVAVENCVTSEANYVPLAGPANRQGRVAATNVAGREDTVDCVTPTSITKVFDQTVAATGCCETALQDRGIDYETSYTFSKSHAGYYPGAEPMWVKLLFDPDDGRLYGAQIVGGEGVDKRIDVLSTAIEFEKRVFDLQGLDLAYAPPFGSAKDPVNMAGFAAGNVVRDVVDVVHWHDIEDLDPEEYAILDCRPPEEREDAGYLDRAINIPIDQLRDRLDELPTDRTIVAHCKAGLRSYITTRMLVGNGFDAANLAGGFDLFAEVRRDREARAEEPTTAVSALD